MESLHFPFSHTLHIKWLLTMAILLEQIIHLQPFYEAVKLLSYL